MVTDIEKFKIDIKDIISFCDSSLKKTIDEGWEIEHLINSLDIFSIDDNKLREDNFLSYVNLYDNPHGSDESSYRHALYFKNKFVAIIGYTGDRGTFYCDWISKEDGINVNNYLFSLNLNSPTLSILDDRIDISDIYTTFFKMGDNFYYQIKSPQWSFSFRKSVENLYVLNEDNSLIHINFVKFKTNKPSWETKEDDEFIIATEFGAKKEFEVPFYQLVFKV